MNCFNFTGNLGKDCNVNQVGSGTVCNFTVAVKSGWGDKAQTLWLDCALWGKQAESKLPDHLLKGTQVAVSGELGTREYEKDGQTRTALTVRVSSIYLIGGKPEAREQPSQQAPAQAQAPSQGFDDFDDDLPF